MSADILSIIMIEQSASRFKKHSERLEGFKDTRSTNSERPRVKDLTNEEFIER